MAREEAHREDLLARRAPGRRIELRTADFAEPIVIGFRATGCGSVYFGQDEAYHFNSHHELRRAYVDGLLYKAEQRQLIALRRERTDNAVQLLRRELDDAAQQAFLERMKTALQRLLETLQHGQCAVAGQVPADADVIDRSARWLTKLLSAPLIIATRPHAD